MDVIKLYPQYNLTTERRQLNPVTPVSFERRSGVDRRTEDRIKLDTNLTRDIFEVRSKVAQIPLMGAQTTPKAEQHKVENTTFNQNISKAAQNELKTDQFIKTTKPESTEVPTTAEKEKSDAGALAGVLGVMLGGVLASSFLGVAGAVLAVGLGGYFGGKFLKNAIVAHIKGRK